MREKPGREKGNRYAKQDDGGNTKRCDKCRVDGSECAGNENRGDGDESGKPAITGDEIIGEHSDEPFTRGVDNTASDDACGVAAKAHAHGWWRSWIWKI